jgi:primosomal protein N' (replication factor Y) (superfamily II helicase)
VASLTTVRVAVEAPRHAGIGSVLDYTSEQPLAPGTLVLVPLGRREVPGLVWDALAGAALDAPAPADAGQPPVLRPVTAVLDALPPLGQAWRALVQFAADYYQRGVGELAMAVLPPELRKLDNTRLARRVAKLPALVKAQHDAPPPAEQAPSGHAPAGHISPQLNSEQQAALATLAQNNQPALLHGVTGSGKTEVYLHAAQSALARGQQALVLVPEINLTPQLESRFAARFPGRVLVSLHSGLTPAQRLRNWLLAHLGLADLVLGTRLAVFASMPRLGLIVVDEEHDPSFKQQEGARYSARDLAIWRAHHQDVPVLLGSATPSLETWQRVQEGRYRRLPLNQRIGGGALPRVRLLDMSALPKNESSHLRC